MCKVSIIIVSYNEKEYLERALNSCRIQQGTDYEIIIGDDGSTDGSIEYIKNLKEDIRSFVMPRDPNEEIIPSIRVSNIIKRGIDISKGEYLVVLSGDDYFTDEHKLYEAVSFLDKNEEYSAYVSGFQVVTDTAVNKVIIPHKWDVDSYWSGRYLHVSCFVFRTISSDELLERMCDDYGIQYVIALNGKWFFADKVTFAYYQRSGSIMHSADKIELAILEIMVFQDICNYEMLPDKRIWNATLSKYFFPLLYLFCHKKRIMDEKYRRYTNNCSRYSNDYLSLFSNYHGLKAAEKSGIWKSFIKMIWYKGLYIIRRRIIRK